MTPELRALIDARNTTDRGAGRGLGWVLLTVPALTLALTGAAVWPGTWAATFCAVPAVWVIATAIYHALPKEH